MRVLLADDHALFRAGLATLLKAWGLEVVGGANDGNEAVARNRELHPDLIFMDITMPNLNGLEATRAIKAEFPDTKIVILTASDDEQDLFEAVKSGAEGYLLKNLRPEEFADFVGHIDRGDSVISSALAKKLLQEFARLKTGVHHAPDDAGLTDRETEVLENLTGGFSNKQIAAALFISENTVNFHVKNILSKLHLRNRTQVVAWALERGYTSRLDLES